MYGKLLSQLKLVFNIYVHIFNKRKLLQNFEKCFLSYQNGFFGPEDIQVFGLSTSPLFHLLTTVEFPRESN